MADEGVYFERLAGLLEKYGFEWVVSQAQSEIAEGKVVAKDVQAPELIQAIESESFIRRTPRRRRASLIASQPYNDAERLAILLRAMEAAIIVRADLERSVLDAVGDVSFVEFRPDESGATRASSAPGRKAHRLERGRLASATAVRSEFAEALRRLREVVDDRT